MSADKIEDVYVLSPLQAGMLFHSLYAPQAGVYLDQQLYELNGPLNHSAFEDAWQYLLARHPILRTSFHWEGLKEPRQVVHRRVEVPLECCDWRGLSEPEQKERLHALHQQDRARGVDLTQAPLMRLTLIRTGEQTWQWLWTLHHLLLDRWSGSQVLAEFTTAYQALCAGRRIELSPVRP